MIWLILASLGCLPGNPIPQRVDFVEINHVLDERTGQERYVAIIWWDWSNFHGTYVVRDWRWLSDTGRPVRRGGYWVSEWKRSLVYATGFRETWLLYDSEMENRKLVPLDQRRRIR